MADDPYRNKEKKAAWEKLQPLLGKRWAVKGEMRERGISSRYQNNRASMTRETFIFMMGRWRSSGGARKKKPLCVTCATEGGGGEEKRTRRRASSRVKRSWTP